jgi:hypothetical protein
MKRLLLLVPLALLAACQSAPKYEDDARYTRLAHVLEVHVYSDSERQEAAKTAPRTSHTGVGMGVGVGMGSGGVSFGGISFGIGTTVGDDREVPPQIARGANRFTVQPVGTDQQIEVISYGKFQKGDCVRLFSGHPNAYARLFDLKPGESCISPMAPAQP